MPGIHNTGTLADHQTTNNNDDFGTSQMKSSIEVL